MRMVYSLKLLTGAYMLAHDKSENKLRTLHFYVKNNLTKIPGNIDVMKVTMKR
jgi:hypothetical protein